MEKDKIEEDDGRMDCDGTNCWLDDEDDDEGELDVAPPASQAKEPVIAPTILPTEAEKKKEEVPEVDKPEGAKDK